MTQTALTIVQSDLETYRKHYAPKSSPEEWALFVETCQAYGLSPMRRQIYLVSRPTWNPETKKTEWKATPQVSIEGLRDIAARTEKYQGRVGPFFKSKTGEWSDTWNIDDGAYPYAAKVGVWKENFREPLYAVAYFHEMAQYAGKGSDRKLNNFWEKMGITMLAKCAEAASIRAAFPETSGLYVHEEMQQANIEAEYRATPEPDQQVIEAITGEFIESQPATNQRPTTPKPVQAPRQQFKKVENSQPTNRNPKTPAQLCDELQELELLYIKDGQEHAVDFNALIDITFSELASQGKVNIQKIKERGHDLPPNFCDRLEKKLEELKANRQQPEAA